MTSTASAIAIMAGNGDMPAEIAAEMVRNGEKPLIIGIKDEVSPTLQEGCEAILSFGEVGRLFELLEMHGIQRIIFAGGIVKRPDYRKIRLDAKTLRELPTILRIAAAGGDDSVLTKLAKYFEKHGIELIGVDQAAPGMLAKEGWIAGPRRRLSKKDNMTVDRAVAAALAVGQLDAGQGAIVEDGRVIALEGPEGTDAMLERVGALRKSGRLNPDARLCVLAKIAKPSQDLRADLPAIGPATVEAAAANGIHMIVVEAARSVVLSRQALIECAEALRVSIKAIEAPDAPGQGGT